MALEGSCEREWVTRMKSLADASCEKGNKINYLRTWNPMRPNTLRLTLIINCSERASNIVAHVVKRLWLIGDSSPGVSLRDSVSGRLVSVLEVPRSCPTRVSFNGRASLSRERHNGRVARQLLIITHPLSFHYVIKESFTRLFDCASHMIPVPYGGEGSYRRM